MKPLRCWLLLPPAVLVLPLLVGCSQSESAAPAAAESAMLGDPAPATDQAIIAAADGRQIALTPENTTVQFVGLHADPAKPDPRTGQFNQFTGAITTLDSELRGIKVEIDTASLSTEFEKLTNHLKSADFFNVNEHPKATFTSTKIEPSAGEGQVKITGDLTLLGKTQSITFPATASTGEKFALQAEFKIDRTQFGMDYGTDSVLKEVEMTIKVEE